MRRDLPDVIGLISRFPVEEVIVTTNGWFGTRAVLERIRRSREGATTIQVSLDSVSASDHDSFRGKVGAFNHAVETLRLSGEIGLNTSMRMSVRPGNISLMRQFVDMAVKFKVSRVGFGPIIPTGRAQGENYLMSAEEKHRFHLELAHLRKEYAGQVEVTTEDPLKFALKMPEVWDGGGLDPKEDGVFGGCTAGISSFNVGSGGMITPCAVLPIAIASVIGKTASEIENEYVNSTVVRSLFRRTFDGACGRCSLRRVCGGCRAIPHGLGGNYLGQDPTCWLGGAC